MGLPQPWGSPNLGLLRSVGSPVLRARSIGGQALGSTVLGPNLWHPQPWGFLNLGARPSFGLPQSWAFPPRYWGSHTWGAHSLGAPSAWLPPRPCCFRRLGAHAALGLRWPWGSLTLGHGLGNPATLLPNLGATGIWCSGSLGTTPALGLHNLGPPEPCGSSYALGLHLAWGLPGLGTLRPSSPTVGLPGPWPTAGLGLPQP